MIPVESLDLSGVYQPDPSRRSSLARTSGIIGLSIKQLRHRFLESLLILLGIALGVGVLTGMQSFLGFLLRLEGDAMRLQPELTAVTVQAKTFDLSELYGFGGGEGRAAIRLAGGIDDVVQLTSDDLLDARAGVPGIAYSAAGFGRSTGSSITAIDGRPVEAAGAGQAAGGGLTLELERITPDNFAMRGREMLAGRPLTWEDFGDRSPVVVLDEESVPLLFPDLAPAEAVGHTVTVNAFFGPGDIRGIEWRIVGIVAKEELPSWMPRPRAEANAVRGYAALTAGESGPVPLPQLNFIPEEEGEYDALIIGLESFFSQKYGADRIMVSNPLLDLREFNQSSRSVTLTLMGLAALALFVAAVNILNLFTARVIRRRRLLAMSVALGSERRSLFNRMLVEALLLGVGGSLLGLLPAKGIVALLAALLSSQPGVADIFGGLGLTFSDALVGLAAGIGTSLAFGLYPAYLSASIDPAEGLRRE